MRDEAVQQSLAYARSQLPPRFDGLDTLCGTHEVTVGEERLAVVVFTAADRQPRPVAAVVWRDGVGAADFVGDCGDRAVVNRFGPDIVFFEHRSAVGVGIVIGRPFGLAGRVAVLDDNDREIAAASAAEGAFGVGWDWDRKARRLDVLTRGGRWIGSVALMDD
jgi:hypothetical protein